MSKAKATTTAKSPKTIKVSTLIIAVAVLLSMVASFIAGTVVANNYQNTVKAQAVELIKELKPRK